VDEEVVVDADAEREFRDFVARQAGALYQSAYLLTGDRQHAEDLLQSALTRVALRWRRIRTSPEAYARRVLYTGAVDRWRHPAWRRERATARLPEPAPEQDPAADVDLRLAVVDALRRLTPRQRAVLVLRYLEDLPEAEAAAVLDVSVGTIRSTTYKALARLRVLWPEIDPHDSKEAWR
jgi:RNA polymerase sigma-70 factor (sigma-E family)